MITDIFIGVVGFIIGCVSMAWIMVGPAVSKAQHDAQNRGRR